MKRDVSLLFFDRGYREGGLGMEGYTDQYYKTCRMGLKDTHDFIFDFEIKKEGYLAGFSGLQFSYGETEGHDDHHVCGMKMKITTSVGKDARTITVATDGNMYDNNKGDRHNAQGKKDSYIEVGVLAVPHDAAGGENFKRFAALQRFEMSYKSSVDHEVKGYRAGIAFDGDGKLCSYDTEIHDNSGNMAIGMSEGAMIEVPESVWRGVDPLFVVRIRDRTERQ